MPFNMMIGYDVYDRFTMEHFPLHQRVILTTKIYCSRCTQYNLLEKRLVYIFALTI
jgi:hypothetical protein